MNNIAMAASYLRQAEERLKHARESLESGNYPYTIRACQEAVELSLKSALRTVGIEPPKIHDVGQILRKNANLFPEWFKKDINKVAAISRKLRKEREASMYGDEELSLTPDEIYTEEDAREAVQDCDFVFQNCKRLLNAALGSAP